MVNDRAFVPFDAHSSVYYRLFGMLAHFRPKTAQSDSSISSNKRSSFRISLTRQHARSRHLPLHSKSHPLPLASQRGRDGDTLQLPRMCCLASVGLLGFSLHVHQLEQFIPPHIACSLCLKSAHMGPCHMYSALYGLYVESSYMCTYCLPLSSPPKPPSTERGR